MLIHQTTQNGNYILQSNGRMDFKARKAFQSATQAAHASEAHHIVVNLKDVSFIDSAGLALLLLAGKECIEKNVRFSLCQPQGYVNNILNVARVKTQFPVFDTLEEALK